MECSYLSQLHNVRMIQFLETLNEMNKKNKRTYIEYFNDRDKQNSCRKFLRIYALIFVKYKHSEFLGKLLK